MYLCAVLKPDDPINKFTWEDNITVYDKNIYLDISKMNRYVT